MGTWNSTSRPTGQARDGQIQSVDVAIVGAGFGGLYMLHKCRSMGLSARVFERADGVGGTWYWNRYPGARCDVESLEYSYSFDSDLQQEWEWTERYAGQPEILRYIEHVADRFDLRSDIVFGATVSAATFDRNAAKWRVTIDSATTQTCSAQFLVMATGCLSSANRPRFPGLDSFEGEIYHTGEWPHDDVDFTGTNVGVVGTGSSGIQTIPIIARRAKTLTVFQRTPNYSVPAHNGPLQPAEVESIKADYEQFRADNLRRVTAFGSRVGAHAGSALSHTQTERDAIYQRRWDQGGFAMLSAFDDLMFSDEANATARQFVSDKIRSIVDDPETAEALTPDQVIGCKRLCVDSGYFETFNLDHVSLVDIATNPIEKITPTGLRLADGTNHAIDQLVFATGFDAMTGALLKIDIRCDETSLAEAWENGPVNYLGLMVPGLPNLFTITGPGSPSVLANMVIAIEQHVNWIADLIQFIEDHGSQTVEPSAQAATDWVGHVNAVADATLMATCNSWYLGSNIPGKTRMFMPLIGFPSYVEQCERVASSRYEGFLLS